MYFSLRRWLLLALILFPAGAFADERPNFLVVLCDDLGYGDLACYGHPDIKTPHVDRFAKEGLRLTSCYSAAPNCSPARTGLMTGRTPYRVGIHNWIPYGSPMRVRREEVTVAALLQGAGYATCHAGKWHMSGRLDDGSQPQPPDHGFDHWFSTQNNALPNHENPENFVRNGEPVGKLEGFSAQLVADEAIRWLTDGRDPEQPFFLYVCFHEPHEPIKTADRFSSLYETDDASLAAHHGNITQMDDAFGRLMASLDELELANSTLVFFTSDNGPAITSRHPHGSAGPLRDKKGAVYEGGIRVPGLLRWPGKIAPGSTSDEPVCGVDLLPTLCELAGIKPPSDRAIDGSSFAPLIRGGRIERTTPLYWQFNFSHATPKVALRDGRWKITATLAGNEFPRGGDILEEDQRAIKTARLDQFELYDLHEDVAEERNVAEQEPQRLAELSDRLKTMYGEVTAETPTWPAWEWPRHEAQRIEWGP